MSGWGFDGRRRERAELSKVLSRGRWFFLQISGRRRIGKTRLVLELLKAHADTTPERLLFLWNLFEGVPKFYRDCYEQGVIDADRQALLERMFFSSSSPLRSEADNWFLRELRGRYDLVLKYVARHPGCTHADLQAHADSVAPEIGSQVAGYLKTLEEKYEMVEKRLPVFAKAKARRGRYTIRDNFLRSWLDALALPTAAIHFRPLEDLVEQADQRLMMAEGYGLERLVGQLYEERSRLGVGDFPLTSRIEGWWDRSDTEIDLVALDETAQRLRLGSCKRSAAALVADLGRFDGHVARFLGAFPRLSEWEVEKVAIAPCLNQAARQAIVAAGYVPQSLDDLTEGLG